MQQGKANLKNRPWKKEILEKGIRMECIAIKETRTLMIGAKYSK